jgi:hypothetical protein
MSWIAQGGPRKLARSQEENQRQSSRQLYDQFLRTNMRGFPVVASHGAACCFRCGSVLDIEQVRDDYWPGGGQFSAPCVRCGVRTWYDVAGVVEEVHRDTAS